LVPATYKSVKGDHHPLFPTLSIRSCISLISNCCSILTQSFSCFFGFKGGKTSVNLVILKYTVESAV